MKVKTSARGPWLLEVACFAGWEGTCEFGKQPESGCLQHANDKRVDPIGLHEARIGLLEAAIGLSVGPDTPRRLDAGCRDLPTARWRLPTARFGLHAARWDLLAYRLHDANSPIRAVYQKGFPPACEAGSPRVPGAEVYLRF